MKKLFLFCFAAVAATMASCSKDESGGAGSNALAGTWLEVKNVCYYDYGDGEKVLKYEDEYDETDGLILVLYSDGRLLDDWIGFDRNDWDCYYIYKDNRIYRTEIKGTIDDPDDYWDVIKFTPSELVIVAAYPESTGMIHYNRILERYFVKKSNDPSYYAE